MAIDAIKPPRITYLKVRNYRALKDIEFKDLMPLTAFIGPNGSRKSTVFDVFAFLSECFSEGLRRAWDKRGRFRVINRIAVEELESWFFGDVQALRRAFPRLPRTLGHSRSYRDPDAIRGGTWEALRRVLPKASYYGEIFPSIEVARKISRHMNPNQNSSRSFRVFCEGLESLLP